MKLAHWYCVLVAFLFKWVFSSSLVVLVPKEKCLQKHAMDWWGRDQAQGLLMNSGSWSYRLGYWSWHIGLVFWWPSFSNGCSPVHLWFLYPKKIVKQNRQFVIPTGLMKPTHSFGVLVTFLFKWLFPEITCSSCIPGKKCFKQKQTVDWGRHQAQDLMTSHESFSYTDWSNEAGTLVSCSGSLPIQMVVLQITCGSCVPGEKCFN